MEDTGGVKIMQFLFSWYLPSNGESSGCPRSERKHVDCACSR